MPSFGIRVGNDTNPTVFGSGDFGETGRVHGIPLTSTMPPVTGKGIPYNPLANVFILRDTSADTYVDGYDTSQNLPAPDLFAIDDAVLSSPVGITDGPDDYVYVVGAGNSEAASFTVVDPENGSVLNTNTFMDFAGSNIRMTNLARLPWQPLPWVYELLLLGP